MQTAFAIVGGLGIGTFILVRCYNQNFRLYDQLTRILETGVKSLALQTDRDLAEQQAEWIGQQTTFLEKWKNISWVQKCFIAPQFNQTIKFPQYKHSSDENESDDDEDQEQEQEQEEQEQEEQEQEE